VTIGGRRRFDSLGDVWVGLDLGTSGLKGVAVGADRRVLARGRRAYPTHHPEPGACEQDPADWLAAVDDVVAQLRTSVDDTRWAGIGLSAMLPTLVTVDADSRPTGPAVTWEDCRAESQGEALREQLGADELYRRTGQWVDGRYLLPMWRRICDTDPGRAAGTTMLLGAKDFVVLALTGHAVTDPSTATGAGCFDLTSGTWGRDLGVGDGPALPDVVRSTAGYPLSPAAAARLRLPEGLSLHVGAADSVLGALGMGVAEPGDIAYVAGTSTVVIGIADEHVIDPGHRFLVTPTADDGRWGLEMDLLATGSAFRWLAGLVAARDETQVLALAASADHGGAPLVLPYVAPGEQGALWDPDLVGSVIGLHLGHGPGDLALGLVHGIVAESRRCLHVLESLGFERRPLRVAGGSAADPWFRQQLADATGRDVVAPVRGQSDYSAVGAAMVAAAGAGVRLPPPPGATTTTVADPARSAWWEGLSARLDEARSLVGRGVESGRAVPEVSRVSAASRPGQSS
jgi:xylulokinase